MSSVWDDYWAGIELQLERLKGAKTAQEVITFLGGRVDDENTGVAFTGTDGGDMAEVLTGAGWSVLWMEAGYHWAMQAPDGSAITYVEGDVFLGNQRPLPHKETPSAGS